MKMLELKQNSSWRLTWSSWQWLKLFQRPPKLLLIQALLFLHVLSPLVGIVNSQSEQNDDFIPFTTSTESTLLQRVTISSSYSNTNYKAGPVSPLTIISHNNNNFNISNLNPNDGLRRRLLTSAKDLPHSSSSRSSNSRKNRTNNQKQRNLRNNAHKNNIHNKLSRGSVGSGTSIRRNNMSTTTTTTKKPTMHPLRVLQTEISTPARISVIKSSTPVVPTNITKVTPYQYNLENHRLNSGEIMKTLPTTSEQYLTDEIKSQLALINRGVKSEALVSHYDALNSNKNELRSNVAQNKLKPSMASAGAAAEGRSSLDSTEIVKPTNMKQRSDNGKSISVPDQGKNMKSAPFSNYFNTYTDNIAEEDHQYEVTELVNQFTGEYDSHRNDDQREEEGHREEEGLQQSSSSQQYHQHHDGQQEVVPYEMQASQRPNHNHYHRRPNLKPKKNRPKLNSYYDQNYYAASSVQAEPASDNNNHEQHHSSEHYGYRKQKEHHYYENSNNYHGNDDTGDGSHYANPPQSHPQHHHGSPYLAHAPTTGPQQYYPQLQQLHHQQTISHMGSGHQPEYPTTAIQPQIIPTVSSTSSTSSGSRHPAPQPYNGEHDNQSSDSIMDRFEVFYTEYKLLAWIGLFGLISLGFVILIVVLYLRNPPTEVVTARSMLTQYLNDPSLLKFLSNILDDQAHVGKKVRRRKKIN